MNILEQIRAEVERRMDYLFELFFTSKELEQKEAMHDCDLLVREYGGLLSFLDTLQEQEPQKEIGPIEGTKKVF